MIWVKARYAWGKDTTKSKNLVDLISKFVDYQFYSGIYIYFWRYVTSEAATGGDM